MAAVHRIAEFEEGRTDLLIPLLEEGIAPSHTNQDGVSLIQTCAYYGDVTAIRYLLTLGENLQRLGPNLGLSEACFHGHWRLCLLLLENGAQVNDQAKDTLETPLHAALSHTDRVVYDRVVEVLLAHGADPNLATAPGVETGAFMRDCRTKGETTLHRAAAFGEEGTIAMLLQAGARRDSKDAYGDTPLSWASWYGRPASILNQLCYGPYRVNPDRKTMRENLIGFPQKPQ